MASWLSFAVVALSFLQLVPVGLCSWDGEWDPDELDIFDVVEEIGENFYDIMQIDQVASQSDLRRAYRKLSLQLHPDKSDDPNAAEKFRKMATVYEILKDVGKRKIYDEVLEEGLPDWKQPVYYYRKMRKMGLMEVSLILLGITSVGHYLYGWANYAEKKLVLQDILERKKKKEQRKVRQIKALHAKQVLEAELEAKTAEAQASKPKFKNLLPFLLIRHLFLLLLALLAYFYKKLGRKDSTSCVDDKKYHKKRENNKSHASKSPSAKRKNGNVRAKRVDSDSSESEFEKKEVDVKSNGIERSSRLESVDESEDEKRSSTESKEATASPGKKGEKKTSQADPPVKKENQKSPQVGSKDSMEAKGKEPKKEDGRRGGENSTGGAASKDGQKGGKGADSGKKESRREEIRGAEKTMSGRDGKGEAISAGSRGTEKVGEDKRLEKGEGATGTRRREKEAVQERKEDGKDVDGLHRVNGRDAKEGSSSAPSSNGWKVAGPGRSKPQKKKAEVGQNDISEDDRSEREDSLTPKDASQNESSQNGMWTQLQQDKLELGLSKYSKSSEDRWLNIAKTVAGKSVDECKLRCVHLYEELKSKKSS